MLSRVERNNMPQGTTIFFTRRAAMRTAIFACLWLALPSSHQVTAMGRRPNVKRKAALRIIAVDPGHGGRDPGAIGCRGAMEKNVTLAIGLDLARLIDRAPGVRAVLTRNSDRYVGLRQRRWIARKAGACLFVSIHANSGKPSWRGATVYAQPMRDPKEKASEQLAALITRQLTRIEPVDKPRRANFVVLRSTRIPSVLVETGYITNPVEEHELTNRAFQEKIASAIFRGIMQFVQLKANATK